MYRVSRSGARRVVLEAQLLRGTTSSASGTDGVASAVEHLGYVQIDTISVVERAHHHTLWNRCSDYDPGMLHLLQAEEKRVFEYWGHAASYLPMSDYRFYLRRMESFRNPKSGWEKWSFDNYRHMMEPVLRRIRAEGPLASKDFVLPPGTARGEWWDWKPAKGALELLFWQGDLMVTERRNFSRVYDLTERVLPPEVDTSLPSPGEQGRFNVERALRALGIASEREINGFIRASDRELISQALAGMAGSTEIAECRIEGDETTVYYALPDVLEGSEAGADPVDDRAVLLSPFDSLIIQRDRTRKLFGFDYVLECYQPEKKRKHGYFSLPILWREELVGRLDPKADRKMGVLLVRSIIMEPGTDYSEPFTVSLAAALKEYAAFNGCSRIRIEKASPASLKQILGRHLK